MATLRDLLWYKIQVTADLALETSNTHDKLSSWKVPLSEILSAAKEKNLDLIKDKIVVIISKTMYRGMDDKYYEVRKNIEEYIREIEADIKKLSA